MPDAGDNVAQFVELLRLQVDTNDFAAGLNKATQTYQNWVKELGKIKGPGAELGKDILNFSSFKDALDMLREFGKTTENISKQVSNIGTDLKKSIADTYTHMAENVDRGVVKPLTNITSTIEKLVTSLNTLSNNNPLTTTMQRMMQIVEPNVLGKASDEYRKNMQKFAESLQTELVMGLKTSDQVLQALLAKQKELMAVSDKVTANYEKQAASAMTVAGATREQADAEREAAMTQGAVASRRTTLAKNPFANVASYEQEYRAFFANIGKEAQTAFNSLPDAMKTRVDKTLRIINQMTRDEWKKLVANMEEVGKGATPKVNTDAAFAMGGPFGALLKDFNRGTGLKYKETSKEAEKLLAITKDTSDKYTEQEKKAASDRYAAVMAQQKAYTSLRGVIGQYARLNRDWINDTQNHYAQIRALNNTNENQYTKYLDSLNKRIDQEEGIRRKSVKQGFKYIGEQEKLTLLENQYLVGRSQASSHVEMLQEQMRTTSNAQTKATYGSLAEDASRNLKIYDQLLDRVTKQRKYLSDLDKLSEGTYNKGLAAPLSKDRLLMREVELTSLVKRNWSALNLEYRQADKHTQGMEKMMTRQSNALNAFLDTDKRRLDANFEYFKNLEAQLSPVIEHALTTAGGNLDSRVGKSLINMQNKLRRFGEAVKRESQLYDARVQEIQETPGIAQTRVGQLSKDASAARNETVVAFREITRGNDQLENLLYETQIKQIKRQEVYNERLAVSKKTLRGMRDEIYSIDATKLEQTKRLLERDQRKLGPQDVTQKFALQDEIKFIDATLSAKKHATETAMRLSLEQREGAPVTVLKEWEQKLAAEVRGMQNSMDRMTTARTRREKIQWGDIAKEDARRLNADLRLLAAKDKELALEQQLLRIKQQQANIAELKARKETPGIINKNVLATSTEDVQKALTAQEGLIKTEQERQVAHQQFLDKLIDEHAYNRRLSEIDIDEAKWTGINSNAIKPVNTINAQLENLRRTEVRKQEAEENKLRTQEESAARQKVSRMMSQQRTAVDVGSQALIDQEKRRRLESFMEKQPPEVKTTQAVKIATNELEVATKNLVDARQLYLETLTDPNAVLSDVAVARGLYKESRTKRSVAESQLRSATGQTVDEQAAEKKQADTEIKLEAAKVARLEKEMNRRKALEERHAREKIKLEEQQGSQVEKVYKKLTDKEKALLDEVVAHNVRVVKALEQQLAVTDKRVAAITAAKSSEQLKDATSIGGIIPPASDVEKFKEVPIVLERSIERAGAFGQIWSGFTRNLGGSIGQVIKFNLLWNVTTAVMNLALLPLQKIGQFLANGIQYLITFENRVNDVRQAMLSTVGASKDMTESFKAMTVPARQVTRQIEEAAVNIGVSFDTMQSVLEGFTSAGGMRLVAKEGDDVAESYSKAIKTVQLLIAGYASAGGKLTSAQDMVRHIRSFTEGTATAANKVGKAIGDNVSLSRQMVESARVNKDLYEQAEKSLQRQLLTLQEQQKTTTTMWERIKYNITAISATIVDNAHGIIHNTIKLVDALMFKYRIYAQYRKAEDEEWMNMWKSFIFGAEKLKAPVIGKFTMGAEEAKELLDRAENEYNKAKTEFTRQKELAEKRIEVEASRFGMTAEQKAVKLLAMNEKFYELMQVENERLQEKYSSDASLSSVADVKPAEREKRLQDLKNEIADIANANKITSAKLEGERIAQERKLRRNQFAWELDQHEAAAKAKLAISEMYDKLTLRSAVKRVEDEFAIQSSELKASRKKIESELKGDALTPDQKQQYRQQLADNQRLQDELEEQKRAKLVLAQQEDLALTREFEKFKADTELAIAKQKYEELAGLRLTSQARVLELERQAIDQNYEYEVKRLKDAQAAVPADQTANKARYQMELNRAKIQHDQQIESVNLRTQAVYWNEINEELERKRRLQELDRTAQADTLNNMRDLANTATERFAVEDNLAQLREDEIADQLQLLKIQHALLVARALLAGLSETESTALQENLMRQKELLNSLRAGRDRRIIEQNEEKARNNFGFNVVRGLFGSVASSKVDESGNIVAVTNPALAAFQKLAKGGQDAADVLQTFTGAINSAVQAVISGYQSGGVGGAIGAGLGQVGAFIPGPIGGAMQVAGTALSLISSAFTAAARRLARKLEKEFAEITKAFSQGRATLADTIIAAEQKRQEMIARLSGKKGGKKQLDELLPGIEDEIFSLKKQAEDIRKSFEDQLALLKLQDDVLSDFRQQWSDIVKQVEEYLGAVGKTEESTKNANEFLRINLLKLQTNYQQDLNDAEQEAIQDAITLNKLLEDRTKLVEDWKKTEFELLNADAIERRQAGTVLRASEYQQRKKEYEESLQQIDSQIDLGIKKVAIEQEVFDLTASTAELQARSDELELEALTKKVSGWKTIKGLIEDIGEALSKQTYLNPSLNWGLTPALAGSVNAPVQNFNISIKIDAAGGDVDGGEIAMEMKKYIQGQWQMGRTW